MVVVPIVDKVTERVIEKTEVIKEQPIHIENKDTGNDIVKKINNLLPDDEKIDAKHIKNLPEYKLFG